MLLLDNQAKFGQFGIFLGGCGLPNSAAILRHGGGIESCEVVGINLDFAISVGLVQNRFSGLRPEIGEKIGKKI